MSLSRPLRNAPLERLGYDRKERTCWKPGAASRSGESGARTCASGMFGGNSNWGAGADAGDYFADPRAFVLLSLLW